MFPVVVSMKAPTLPILPSWKFSKKFSVNPPILPTCIHPSPNKIQKLGRKHVTFQAVGNADEAFEFDDEDDSGFSLVNGSDTGGGYFGMQPLSENPDDDDAATIFVETLVYQNLRTVFTRFYRKKSGPLPDCPSLPSKLKKKMMANPNINIVAVEDITNNGHFVGFYGDVDLNNVIPAVAISLSADAIRALFQSEEDGIILERFTQTKKSRIFILPEPFMQDHKIIADAAAKFEGVKNLLMLKVKKIEEFPSVLDNIACIAKEGQRPVVIFLGEELIRKFM